jgi:hypothetical protein
MKKFIINCDTYWCGTDNSFRALAESKEDLDDLAFELAYDNFCSYCDTSDILEDLGYDIDDLSDEEIEDILENTDESMYYHYSIDECNDEEEWNSFNDDHIYIVNDIENE